MSTPTQNEIPEPTSSHSGDTDDEEAMEMSTSQIDVSPTLQIQPAEMDLFKSALLYTDQKIIQMVQKDVLVVPQNKIHELAPLVQMKLHADVIKQKSNIDIKIVDEIPADGLGNQFQIIKNWSSVHRASNSAVSKLVAQEMQFNCDILQQKLLSRETIHRLCKVDDQVLLQKQERTAMEEE